MKRLSVLALPILLLLSLVSIAGAEEIDVHIDIGKFASLALDGHTEVRLSLPKPEESDKATISFALKSNAPVRLRGYWDEDFRNKYHGLLHMTGILTDRDGELIWAGGSWLVNFDPGKHDLNVTLKATWKDTENPATGHYWWTVEPGELQTTYTLIVEAL